MADETQCDRILMPAHCVSSAMCSAFIKIGFLFFFFGDASALKQRKNLFYYTYCIVLLRVECYRRNSEAKEDLDIGYVYTDTVIRSGKSIKTIGDESY
jgi:hypothetical protein